MDDKWPRQYFEEMRRLKKSEDRAKYLESVPEHLREIVKTHFMSWWNREVEKRNRDKRPE